MRIITRILLIMFLLLSLAGYPGIAYAGSNAKPQDVLNQVPFVGGKSVIYLSWHTGNIADSQNFDAHLSENFALYLSRAGVSKDIIPEIINNVSNITAEAKLKEKNFVQDKDKFRSEITYKMLRLKELRGGIQVLTPPWWDAEEINLSSPEVRSLTIECGTSKDIKAIEFKPAKDMSNLMSIDDVSVQVIKALNNGNSLVLQNVMTNPDVRNAAVLVKGHNIANRSSGLRYMVLGNNQDAVNCILSKISDASGVSGSSIYTGSGQNSEAAPPVLSPLPSPIPSPIPPVPELSTVALTAAGLIGLFLLVKLRRD